jgi:hypothetical protein
MIPTEFLFHFAYFPFGKHSNWQIFMGFKEIMKIKSHAAFPDRFFISSAMTAYNDRAQIDEEAGGRIFIA